MSRLLIATVGTSLLTNRDERPWTGWDGRRGDALPSAKEVDTWLATCDPVKATAETNTLQALAVDTSDRLLFLHSDTPEGQFCSASLCTYYLQAIHCMEANSRKIASLGYHHASFAQNGLKSLISVTLRAIRSAHERHLLPVFCATGGFKAEIAFLNILGALLDIEIFYIHEQFREIVRLPRLPLTWDTECVIRYKDFFDWIDAEPRRSQEVENRLHTRPELRSLVEDDSDGHSYLNAAGNLLYQAALERHAQQPRAVWPAAIAQTPGEKNGVSGKQHHRPKGWENFVERLCGIDCVSRVSYDEAAYGGSAVKILDASSGTLTVRFGPSDSVLPLRIETAARGEAQTELVAEYIRGRLKAG